MKRYPCRHCGHDDSQHDGDDHELLACNVCECVQYEMREDDLAEQARSQAALAAAWRARDA